MGKFNKCVKMWDFLAQISNNNSCDAKSCSLLHFQHWFQSSCWDFCHSQTLKRLSATHPRSFLSCWGIVSAILNLFTAGGQTGVVSVTVQSLSVTWLKVWSATKLPERSYCAKKNKKHSHLSNEMTGAKEKGHLFCLILNSNRYTVCCCVWNTVRSQQNFLGKS